MIKSYWYRTYISRKDESAVGFVLVDTRTKETIFINRRCNRICGSKFSAGRSKKRISGFANSYNINNIPTYVMTLKDKGGLVKMFAMVAI
jgi:hypothetical protein